MTIRVRFVSSFVVCVASVFLLASAVRAQSVFPLLTEFFESQCDNLAQR